MNLAPWQSSVSGARIGQIINHFSQKLCIYMCTAHDGFTSPLIKVYEERRVIFDLKDIGK